MNFDPVFATPKLPNVLVQKNNYNHKL